MLEKLKRSRYLSIDIETFDPKLKSEGTGVYRSTPLDFRNVEGYILGVGLKNENNDQIYVNLGHYDCTEAQRAKNLQALHDLFFYISPSTIFVGQNLIYDFDWLINWAKLPIQEHKIIDVGISEALLDENQRKYNLDFMGEKYFGEGKDKSEVQEYCDEAGFKGDPRKWLWKMPHSRVNGYVMQDIGLPLRIWEVQEPLIEAQNLGELMNLECSLTWPLLNMRKNGVPIDINRREAASAELAKRIEGHRVSLKERMGFELNTNKTKDKAFMLEQLDVPVPVTKLGNDSVTTKYMKVVANGMLELPDGQIYHNPEAEQILLDVIDMMQSTKIRKDFLEGSMKTFLTPDGLLHCNFHNMMTDENGARSGRFSSSKPNLQQIPSTGKSKYYGTLARDCFVPLEDHWWCKVDYSQIEYRFMAHFARGTGALEVQAKYNADPYTDYHQMIVDLTGLQRRDAKVVNFGVAYGMGVKKLALENHWDMDYARAIMRTYHANAPFIKTTVSTVEDHARRRGYIRTFLGRRSRLLDPSKAYTMYCRLNQGSAADLMKKAMYEVYEAGIFDSIKVHLTVHDELDASVPKTKEGLEAVGEMKNIMENCVKLRVPIIADLELGSSWAKLTGYKHIEEAHKLLEAI